MKKSNFINRIILWAVVLLWFPALFFYTTSQPNTGEYSDVEIKALVQGYSARTLPAKSSSITSSELIVTDENDKKISYKLPKDEFFVSIAPYIHTTHPCAIHSLSGCQGEMVQEEFELQISDTKGNLIVEKTVTTPENGFIDLWLPRNASYEVIITQGERQATSKISTYHGDNTCITTMQLI